MKNHKSLHKPLAEASIIEAALSPEEKRQMRASIMTFMAATPVEAIIEEVRE